MRRVAGLPLVALLALQSTGHAQTPPRFEVASLKARDRNVPLGLVGMQSTPGRLINRCATLTSLVYYPIPIPAPPIPSVSASAREAAR